MTDNADETLVKLMDEFAVAQARHVEAWGKYEEIAARRRVADQRRGDDFEPSDEQTAATLAWHEAYTAMDAAAKRLHAYVVDRYGIR